MIYGYEHAVQFSVLAKAVGCGYALGVLYLLTGILKFAGRRYVFLNIVRDILFFVLSSVFSFMFLLKFNAGIFRFYLLCGETLGFVLFMIFPGAALISKMNIFHKKLFKHLSLSNARAAAAIKTAAKRFLRLIGKKEK